MKTNNNLHKILRNLTIELRKGDQITILHDGYQVHYKNVGTSNFKIVKIKIIIKMQVLTTLYKLDITRRFVKWTVKVKDNSFWTEQGQVTVRL